MSKTTASFRSLFLTLLGAFLVSGLNTMVTAKTPNGSLAQFSVAEQIAEVVLRK